MLFRSKYCLYASDASIYSASLNSKQINRVTFATIGSIIKLPDKTLKLFDIIIIDECHLVSLEGQYYDLISIIEPQKLIGLTATPYRNNFKYSVTYEMLTRKRNPIFKTIGYKYEIADCIKDGFWSELKYFMPIQYEIGRAHV